MPSDGGDSLPPRVYKCWVLYILWVTINAIVEYGWTLEFIVSYFSTMNLSANLPFRKISFFLKTISGLAQGWK